MRSWLSVLITDAESKKVFDIPIAPSLYSLSNKMDNSLLAVRVINHKYIVVEKSCTVSVFAIRNFKFLFQCILPGDLPIQPGIQRVQTYINTVDTCSFQRPCLFLQQYAIRCQCHLLHTVQRFYLAYKLYTVLSYQWLATGNLEPGNTRWKRRKSNRNKAGER